MCIMGKSEADSMKQDHPASPSNSDSGSYMGNPGDSTNENGYHHTSTNENGYHDHMSDSDNVSMGSPHSGTGSDDAPLDFSMKKSRFAQRSSSENSSDAENHQPGGIDAIATSLAQNAISRQLHVRTEAGEKIGEPMPAFPGMVPPGFPLPPALLPMGLLNTMLPYNGPHPDLMKPVKEEADGSRPFKAFPKDPLSMPLGAFGLPGMLPMPNMDSTAVRELAKSSEQLARRYEDYISKLKIDNKKDTPIKQEMRHSPTLEDRTPPLSEQLHGSHKELLAQLTQGMAVSPPLLSRPQSSPHDSSMGTPPPLQRGGAKINRKRPRTLPEDMKDAAYWERRRKNNEAAKRSRDARRAKEDEIAMRAAFLEQENLKLRVELAALKNETAKLRCALYTS